MQHNMLLATTIFPWTAEWLLHYEIWLATGEWTGGGYHPLGQTEQADPGDRRLSRDNIESINGSLATLCAAVICRCRSRMRIRCRPAPTSAFSSRDWPQCTAPVTAQADGTTDEQRFIVAVRDHLPMYVIPGGRYATDDDVLASGYEACAALDQYPTDSMHATRVSYPGGNTIDGEITYDGQMFMLYAAIYLCNRHSHLYDHF